MSNKTLLRFVIALGLLAMVLTFLGVNYVPGTSALSSTKGNAVNAAIYAGSDYIERHPSVVAKPVNYAGSDWIERHPTTVSRLKELAHIKDQVFPVDTHLNTPSLREELRQIKDDGLLMDTRLSGPSRPEELARIKER